MKIISPRGYAEMMQSEKRKAVNEILKNTDCGVGEGSVWRRTRVAGSW